MKRKKLIFDPSKSPKKGIYIDNDIFEFSEKTDDPDFMFDFAEGNITADKLKKRKYDKIELNQNGNGNGNGNNSQGTSSSSISNTISSIITPVVAAVAVASTGIVPGLDSLNSINVLNASQNNISASIVSIEQTNTNAKYHINLDFDTDIEKKFDFNDEDVAVTLTNDFTNCEQQMKYNNAGPVEQEYPAETKNNSKISSKYTIKNNSEQALNNEQGSSKHSFTINGFVEGLNQNMNYTLNVKSKGKVLTKQSFKTKTDEDMPPFEIISTEIKTDTYRDIASFEILMNTRNWNESIKFNNEEFVLRISGNQKSVDFKIGDDYSYINKQEIELIYDLSHNQTGASETKFMLRGDISKLAENTNYTMTLLRKNNKIDETSFETSSALKGLEIQQKTN